MNNSEPHWSAWSTAVIATIVGTVFLWMVAMNQAFATPTWPSPTRAELNTHLLSELDLSPRQVQQISAHLEILNRDAQPFLKAIKSFDLQLGSFDVLNEMDEVTFRHLLDQRQSAVNELLVLQFRHRRGLMSLLTPSQRLRVSEMLTPNINLM